MDHRQLRAVVQQRVEVPPLDVRRSGIEAQAVLPRLDVALREAEACVVLGAGSMWV
jgi:hypothetical protein